jgi:acyl-CoA hydrolase
LNATWYEVSKWTHGHQYAHPNTITVMALCGEAKIIEGKQRHTKMAQEKSVSESRVEMAQVMLPVDANLAGNVHGGSIMKLIDTAAGIVAIRHCRANVVTASMDRLDFHEPVFIGELVILRASINYVGETSMEIGVRVEAENLMTGEVRHTNSAYLTMVALDENRKPMRVPRIVPETGDERRRFEEGKMRAERRKDLRKQKRKR